MNVKAREGYEYFISFIDDYFVDSGNSEEKRRRKIGRRKVSSKEKIAEVKGERERFSEDSMFYFSSVEFFK